MSIIRMYKKTDGGVLEFREAWRDAEDGVFVVNAGAVGHQSVTKESPAETSDAGAALLAAFETHAIEDGFRVIPLEEQYWVIAQFALKSVEGTERDRYLERKATSSITSFFAWRGIGVVDRSEFGAGKLNIFTVAPDAAKAVAGIKICARESDLDVTKLSIGVAPYGHLDEIRGKHGLKKGATFTL
ncbi:hypothetical protein [Paenarthrobacter sp. PH39-S1]|uniref:hypothetical protein n=1 Tax=Paenarthrobacter sp. PH39-S1 TaxID=3046204 RepID=UPI0024B996AC|nr:hypothetical protein [Paenarthrobacter sp. PH39-S1]MDJ0357392.1 hypothetical protein [Paenarthrobacter sp. PH39-S1]